MTDEVIFQGDVIIAGGGLAGLTLALALDQAGLKVAVVDALPLEDTLAETFDGRASAIAYTSWRLFEALGIADQLRPDMQRIEEILVCDGRADDGLRPGGPGPHSLHFDREEIHPGPDGEPLGYMVENRHARLALADAIRRSDGIEVFAPARAERYAADARSARLFLSDGRVLSGSLLAACDGKFSRLRHQAGIRTSGWKYGQTGIVATVRAERSHQGVAYEYFLPSGPFAILPLPDNRASLVWTEKEAAAQALLEMDEAGFQEALEARFGDFLGKVTPVTPRFSYPLSLSIADRFCDERVAFVGDSARGIHPIAGQGFNLGIRDVAALAEVCAEDKRAGLDIGHMPTLKRYESWRKLDSASLAAGTDAFTWLFSNDHPLLRLGRGIGLSVVDSIPAARRFFMRQAGGETGDPPRLLRGERLDAVKA